MFQRCSLSQEKRSTWYTTLPVAANAATHGLVLDRPSTCIAAQHGAMPTHIRRGTRGWPSTPNVSLHSDNYCHVGKAAWPAVCRPMVCHVDRSQGSPSLFAVKPHPCLLVLNGKDGSSWPLRGVVEAHRFPVDSECFGSPAPKTSSSVIT